MAEKSLRLNPIPPFWFYRNLGVVYYWGGQYADAVRLLTGRLQEKPSVLRLLTASHVKLNDMDEAKKYAQKLVVLVPKFSLKAHAKAVNKLFREPGMVEDWIATLRKAGLPE